MISNSQKILSFSVLLLRKPLEEMLHQNEKNKSKEKDGVQEIRKGSNRGKRSRHSKDHCFIIADLVDNIMTEVKQWN